LGIFSIWELPGKKFDPVIRSGDFNFLALSLSGNYDED